ncbi:MAG: hypothetical protein BRC28_03265, partial [Nanohaloarchaea archaeon SW_4_43_9]
MDLVVLGVDGVSPDYLEEALEKYDMPGWEKLRDEAFYSDLESCVPAVTIPAWVSMFSGYDAGKFGAFHLTQPDFDSWETGLRKTSFPNTFFWDRIKGRSSLHNIPGTSPVYKIDGWMKGGFPSPHDFDFYPEELEQEMNEKFNLEKKDKRKNTLGAKIEAEFENYELERKVADEIMEKDARVSVSVIKMTDTIGHITESKGNILRAYRKTDDAVQKALEKAEGENANLIVASDHGFFRVKKKFNIVSFLAENDLIDVEKAEGETSLAYRLAEPLLDTPIKKYLRKLHVAYSSFTGNRLDGKSGNYLSNIKKSSTVIPYHKGLGKDCLLKIHTEDMKHGTVTESKKEEIVDTVIEKLRNVERNGEKVIEKVWRGDELYTGESPEIAFRTTDKYVVGTTNAHRNFSKTNALTHHETGIFFAKGPNIHEEADEELEDLFDVAPLI